MSFRRPSVAAPVDAFSYLSVLISIILGLGITQLLTGLGRAIQALRRTVVYPPAMVWTVLLLLIHVQTWWTMFGLRSRATWTFGAFLVVLLQPSVLYLMAALVLPDFAGDEPVDLRANYHAQARWFFGLAVGLLVVSISKDLVLGGELPGTLNLAAHVMWMVLWTAAAITQREWYHRLLAPLMVVLFAVYVALLFTRLS